MDPFSQRGQVLIEFLIVALFLFSLIFMASQMTKEAKKNIHRYQYQGSWR